MTDEELAAMMYRAHSRTYARDMAPIDPDVCFPFHEQPPKEQARWVEAARVARLALMHAVRGLLAPTT